MDWTEAGVPDDETLAACNDARLCTSSWAGAAAGIDDAEEVEAMLCCPRESRPWAGPTTRQGVAQELLVLITKEHATGFPARARPGCIVR